MDADRFAALVKHWAAATTRRGAIWLLSAVPFTGSIATRFLPDASLAARRRVQRRRADRRDSLQDARKKKKKKCAKAGQKTSKKRKKCCQGLVKDGSGVCAASCTPASCAANACGSVPDGCGGTLSCGGCSGNTLCIGGACQPCTVTCLSGNPTICGVDLQLALDEGGTVSVCPGRYRHDFSIATAASVIGAGAGAAVAVDTILQGTGSDSVVRIAAGTTVSLQSLRITGGGGSFGGGISNSSGTLTLTGCTIAGNTANTSGAGVSNSGTLTLMDCTTTGNMADINGGGIFNFDGTVELINSDITGNTAGQFGGGIGNFGGTLTLTASIVSGNTADDEGGGILNNSAGTVTLDATSRVTGNTANPADADSGGGISNYGMVTLSSSANVSDNDPDNCGGPTPVEMCVDP